MRVLCLAILFFLPIAILPRALSEDDLRSGEPLIFRLGERDPVLEGVGPSRSLPYTVKFEGSVFVYDTSDSMDLLLRVSSASGRRITEDDDSGGGKTPFAQLVVQPGQALVWTVAAKGKTSSGKVRFHLFEAPETGETKATRRTGGYAFEEV